MDELLKDLENIKAFLLKKYAQAIPDRIIARTQSGFDVNDMQFIEYRPYTIQKKIEKGQTWQHVTMTDEFNMLPSISPFFSFTNDVLSFGFSSEAMNARAWRHQTGSGIAKREFFGFSESDAEFLTELGQEWIDL